MARTYKRDSRGRFAGGGGGGSGGGGSRPKAKAAPRGANRLTRDNAGKITSIGGNGATARGGRIRTASGKLRATQTSQLKGGARAGTIKGTVRRNLGAGAKIGRAQNQRGRRSANPALAKLARPELRGMTQTQKIGMRSLGNRAINRLAVAARLDKMNKAGQLDKLTPLQNRRAQSVFNAGQRTVNAASKAGVQQRSIRLGIKIAKMQQAADKGSAKPAAPKPPTKSTQPTGSKSTVKLDAMQRSEARHAKRKYGVRSTVKNPGVASRRARRVTTSSGGRVAVRGIAKAKSSYLSKITQVLESNKVNARIKVTRPRGQMNMITGTLDRLPTTVRKVSNKKGLTRRR